MLFARCSVWSLFVLGCEERFLDYLVACIVDIVNELYFENPEGEIYHLCILQFANYWIEIMLFAYCPV